MSLLIVFLLAKSAEPNVMLRNVVQCISSGYLLLHAANVFS